MKPWLAAAISGGVKLIASPTYVSSQTVTIPFGVSRLETLTGEGADGDNGHGVLKGYRTYTVITVYDRSNNITSGPTRKYKSTTFDENPPAEYCQGVQTSSGTTETCYEYESFYYPAEEPTTGASASGFGKTFPGGDGRAATPVTYTGVAVVGGQSYSLAIPSGGSIKFTYYA